MKNIFSQKQKEKLKKMKTNMSQSSSRISTTSTIRINHNFVMNTISDMKNAMKDIEDFDVLVSKY